MNKKFNNHISKVLKKANSIPGIIVRLGGVKNGTTDMAAKSLFLACVVSIFEYGTGVELCNLRQRQGEVQEYSEKLFEECTWYCQNCFFFEVLEMEIEVPL